MSTSRRINLRYTRYNKGSTFLIGFKLYLFVLVLPTYLPIDKTNLGTLLVSKYLYSSFPVQWRISFESILR